MPRQRTLLVAQFAGQVCGLPIEKVQEIVPMASLARPPGLVSLVEGLLNLRGTAVPVLRLDLLFHLPLKPPGLYTPLIVLRDLDCPLALLVERANGIISVSPEAFLPIREGHCFNDCAEAEVALGADGHGIHVLSVERLLLEKERQSIAELQAVAQQRLAELEG